MTPEQDRDYRDYVAAHTRRLCRFAYLCCADWHRAEDVVQTALVRLYANWNRARRKSLDAYVRRIIVNALIDEHRLFRFRREKTTDVLPERPVTPDAPEERLVLISALLRLPKRQRAAVVLRFWEDHTVEQTATILGCSTGAAKNLTMRGLSTLRDLLGEPGFEGSAT
ncbi:RNA polymerase sigma24 factor [Actinorhabdospora filicis]|uniref:RNA polymerase sigma24 factor n=1 Tax=Actinorhabdospora filicis TaxID=1785913 RepID=A0A9W6WBW6_9ACTN|nr:SigE family RNA polymerase sigma factor [Actinorhabdospora filicis]GLZ81049.1 RNA polymerase sigma24 factor [Actinorhabdospora filicis]